MYLAQVVGTRMAFHTVNKVEGLLMLGVRGGVTTLKLPSQPQLNMDDQLDGDLPKLTNLKTVGVGAQTLVV